MVEWINKSWEEISNEAVKSCALALAVDGTDNGLISCFKEGGGGGGGGIEAGRALLESKMRLFTDNKLHKDPFENAAPLFNIINEEEDDDIDIDV